MTIHAVILLKILKSTCPFITVIKRNSFFRPSVCKQMHRHGILRGTNPFLGHFDLCRGRICDELLSQYS